MKDQSPLQDESPIDELDEQLVAYLDGELSNDEVRELEDRLERTVPYAIGCANCKTAGRC